MNIVQSRVSRAFLVAAWLITLAAVVAPPAEGQPQPTRIRDLADFISTQGTYCIDDGAGACLLFVPPVPNYIGWVPAASSDLPIIFGSFDYAGLANATIVSMGGSDLGTTVAGTVMERPLKDGRALVSVNLHTKNALAWANECCDFATGTLFLGARATDVLAGAKPALGDCFLDVSFFNTAPGAELPDLIQLLVAPEDGQGFRSIAFHGTAFGPLHEAFGVPEGTPGKLTVTQTGIFQTAFKGATADGFPAEKVELRTVGEGTAQAPDDPSVGAPAAGLGMVSPNPVRRGGLATFSYQVPEGGAAVDVVLYAPTGRKVVELARSYEAEGIRTLTWDGRGADGRDVSTGVYFLRARIGDQTSVTRLVVVE